MAMEQLSLRIQTIMDKQGVKTVQRTVGALSQPVHKNIDKWRNATRTFRMELLGVMFFGMAIQRVFMGLLSASFQTFKKVTEGTEMANHSIGRLGAAWEFFKFSLINALLATPFFKKFIQWAISALDSLSEINNTQDAIVSKFLLIGAAAGSVLFVFGTMMLGISSLIQATGALAAIWAGLLTPFRAVGFAILYIMSLFAKWMPISRALWTATGAGALAFIGVLILLTKKFGSFGKGMKALASGIVLAIALVVQGVVDLIAAVINDVLSRIQKMIQNVAKLLQSAGFTGLADQLFKAANAIGAIGIQRIDVVGKTAEFLDNVGFNPQAVDGQNQTNNITQFNEFNIDSEFEDSEQLANQVIEKQRQIFNESISRA